MSDALDYMWILYQIHKEVSFEDRTKLWEVYISVDALNVQLSDIENEINE